MKYAVIAAGEGSRLAEEGVCLPKPLVRINGEALIDRLLRIFMDNEADEIVVICNNLSQMVSNHLHDVQEKGLAGKRIPLKVVVKTTPSSMHSFYEISHLLDVPCFCLTTVDTIFSEKMFSEYIRQFKQVVEQNGNGLMGITDFVDDEKPLFVGTDAQWNITGFYDVQNGCKWISAGIYGLTQQAIPVLRRCVANGESRMRNFQRALVTEGLALKAFPFDTVFDIDHAADIEKAERFLNEK